MRRTKASQNKITMKNQELTAGTYVNFTGKRTEIRLIYGVSVALFIKNIFLAQKVKRPCDQILDTKGPGCYNCSTKTPCGFL